MSSEALTDGTVPTTADTIRVSGLSKQYQLGQFHGDTMIREAVVRFLKDPFGQRRRTRDTIWALSDVSFRVQAGEVVGIIGRNGAGKSTLLKLLSRITYPTAGTIDVRGRIASLLEVGTGFHEELTGRENVYLNGSIMGLKKREIDARIDGIVAFAGVEQFLDTPIKRYSSGMRMRLGFAVAAHLEPDILLVDEVLAVGDIQFQKKCLDTMRDLRTGGRTVLLVSHNMAAVENLCQRTIWIDSGRVRMDGSTGQVVRSYMSTFASAEHGTADLESIESRTGHGEARFTRVEFLDAQGQPTQYVRSGDHLVIRVHFRVHAVIQDLWVGIEFNTDAGMRLTATNNWATGYYVPSVSPGESYMDLEIDQLPMMPGRYYLSLWLGKGHHMHDGLQNGVVMDVEPSDYYGTGRGVDSAFGLVFLPCRWKSDRLKGIQHGGGRTVSAPQNDWIGVAE
jgi:lipopolysaccharide transport system ATP-binding protein